MPQLLEYFLEYGAPLVVGLFYLFALINSIADRLAGELDSIAGKLDSIDKKLDDLKKLDSIDDELTKIRIHGAGKLDQINDRLTKIRDNL